VSNATKGLNVKIKGEGGQKTHAGWQFVAKFITVTNRPGPKTNCTR